MAWASGSKDDDQSKCQSAITFDRRGIDQSVSGIDRLQICVCCQDELIYESMNHGKKRREDCTHNQRCEVQSVRSTVEVAG